MCPGFDVVQLKHGTAHDTSYDQSQADATSQAHGSNFQGIYYQLRGLFRSIIPIPLHLFLLSLARLCLGRKDHGADTAVEKSKRGINYVQPFLCPLILYLFTFPGDN